jgi:hypothetical protein
MSALGPGCVKTLSLYLWIWNRWAAVILGVDFSVFAVSMAGARLKSAHSDENGHRFRFEADASFDPKRPPWPRFDLGGVIGAVG